MLYAQTTDPDMIESAKDWRNDVGWQEFYNRYAPAIRHYSCTSGLSEVEAEDVAQETMLKVAKYLPSFEYDRTVCRFRTWLNQIVNQRIFEAIHRRQRSLFPITSLDEIRGVVNSVAMPTGDPVAQAEIERRLLEACLARLRRAVKPRHWQMFEAYAINGHTAEETARLHKSTAANVWMVYHRMVKALRIEWKALLDRPFEERKSG